MRLPNIVFSNRKPLGTWRGILIYEAQGQAEVACEVIVRIVDTLTGVEVDRSRR